MEDWAEIRRLHGSDGTPIKAIFRKLRVSRNTMRLELAASGPPRYQRPATGLVTDPFALAIWELLAQRRGSLVVTFDELLHDPPDHTAIGTCCRDLSRVPGRSEPLRTVGACEPAVPIPPQHECDRHAVSRPNAEACRPGVVGSVGYGESVSTATGGRGKCQATSRRDFRPCTAPHRRQTVSPAIRRLTEHNERSIHACPYRIPTRQRIAAHRGIR